MRLKEEGINMVSNVNAWMRLMVKHTINKDVYKSH